MRLQRLIVQGFKSFKDRTVIEFDDGITGIVGPNGCGKSNIVDALFWVMGEQSAKHLRGTNMKDLIFAGSSKYSPGSYAEVTLVLENDTGKHIHISGTVVKPAEIQLTRKLYRNGETEYRINGEPARLKDIQEVFMDTGAGAKSYSIIAQGEINKLVQAKPEERRVMIEEVAGITKFKLRKRDSLKKIEQTQQNLARLEDLQNEIYKNLKNLERQAEKAEKARTLRERIKRYELIVDSHKELDYLQDYVNAHRILEERKTELEQAQLRRSQIDLLLEDERIQKTDVMEKIETAQEDFNEHSKLLAAAEERLKHLKKAIADKTKLIETRTSENEEIQVDIENRTNRLGELQDQLKELEDANYGEMDFSDREEKVELLKGQLFDMEEELVALKKQAQEAKEEAQRLDNIQFKNSSRLEEYARLLQDLTAEIETLEKQSSNFTDDLVKERDRFKAAAARIEELNKVYPKAKEELEKLSSEVKKLDQESRQLSREVMQLESKRESLIAVNSQAEGKKLGAMDLVKKDETGQLVVLGNLLKCEPSFAIAVEELLGDLLDQVVASQGVDSLEAWAQDFTMNVDIFRPIGEAMSAESVERLKVQGCEGMRPLAEVVSSTDENFTQVLSRMLSGHYIVDNLNAELASRLNAEIQFKGLVSADGKVFLKKNLSGVTYGLRLADHSEMMGVVQRNNLIEELGIELDSKRTELALLEGKLIAVEQKLSEQRDLVEKKAQEFQEASMIHAASKASLESKEASQNSGSARLDILHARRNETSKSRLELMEEEEKMLKAKAQAEVLVKELALQVADLEDRHHELKISFENERDEMMELKVKAQSFQSQLTGLRSQINDVEGMIERYQQKREANMLALEQASTDLESAEAEIGDVENDNREKAEALADKEQFLDLLKDQLSQVLLAMQDKETEMRELTSRINKIDKENVELELKTGQIVQEEELLVKNCFEKHRVDLRSILMKHMEIHSDHVQGMADISVMYSMEGENGPVQVEAQDYTFEKRWPAQVKETREKLKECRGEFSRLGEINWQAIEDYDRQKLRHDFLKSQEEELKKSLVDLQTAITHIDEKSRERFKEAFHEVNERFSKVFPIIFGGGSAKLEITGDIDSIDCGVDIIAQPPGKKMQSITLMSGGEKAMTAVSLIFSIFLVKPSPFCLLDEVDAPLDDANVGRFNELLREMSSETQFILITHNKKTMELNDTLYGVTMQEPGVSKAVSVQLH